MDTKSSAISRKGIIMKNFTKYMGLKIWVALVVAAAFSPVLAEDSNNVSGKERILTTLEERMQKKISVDFRDTPIDDVIRIMADQADVDIVKSPKVTGAVTATLTDVPLQEALNNILAAQGYGYIAGENMIRVAPLSEITEGSEALITRIYRITYADVKEVEAALKKFISKSGSLSANFGTSNIIVTDTESRIKSIDTFINEIDRMTPQILVEARIYDITSKDKLDLGIKWQAGLNTDYDTDAGVTGVGTNPTGGKDNPFATGVFNSTVAAKTEHSIGVLRFGWLNDSVDIDVLLEAQQDKIDAKLLANPRVLVLDNQTAQIKIITEKPYIELSETSGGGSMGTTKFREIGVTLKVTPHLARDDMVRLLLKPEFSVETGTVSTMTVNGESKYPQPIVDRREAETTLLIRNGQTVVLGGLRKKEVSKEVNKVPLLGDIPLIGALFRFTGESTINSELVVFVTPWIVRQPLLSPTEQKQFDATEFSGPVPELTRAESGG
jgi:type IV pilus assembly protein PilQ